MKWKIINKDYLNNMVMNLDMKVREHKVIDTKEIIHNLELYLGVDLSKVKKYLYIV